MLRRGPLVAAVASLFVLSSAPVLAQDSNYWSTAYGTRARLLGGVVIGSPGDISAVYYNPGALALAPDSEFLLSGNAFQYMRVSVTNGSGPRRDLTTSTISTLPSLIAGEIPLLDRDRLAYSLLTRQKVDIDIEKRATTDVQSSSPLPNATFAALDVQFHQDVDEGWYGLTWARQVSPALGIGVTPTMAVRSQRTQGSVFAMGENAANEQAVLQSSRDFDYLHWRLLARFGLSGARDSLTYGVTFTTPGLGLFGGGAYRQSLSLTSQTGTVGNVIGASYQNGLSVEYRSPMGAGAGASFGWGTLRLHVAAEWWAAVDRYNLIEGDPFTVQTPSGDSTVAAVVSEELDDVLNFGIGLEHRFSPDLVGLVSYHTDRSGRSPDSAPGASVTTWDLHHVTAGATFNAWRSNFAVGASVTFGSRPIPPLPNRPDGVPSAALETEALMVTAILGWKISF